MRATTTEECIEKLEKLHPTANWGFHKIKYVNNRTNIKIVCYEKDDTYGLHGTWKRRPGVLFRYPYAGCPKCDKSYKWNTKTWKKAMLRIDSIKFGYHRVKYVNSITPVEILCNKCNKYFWQSPKDHMHRRGGCRRCRSYRKTTTKQWVKKARKVHGRRYSYRKTKFFQGKGKVIITCRKHGDFEQRAQKHLSGHGCPKCGIGYSLPAISWLNWVSEQNPYIKIQHAVNGGEFRIPGTAYHADGYDEDNNTIYEFFGDYWHGNLEMFDGDKYHSQAKMSFKELYQKTMNRVKEIENLGYEVVYIWESDWEWLATDQEWPYKYKEDDPSDCSESDDSD